MAWQRSKPGPRDFHEFRRDHQSNRIAYPPVERKHSVGYSDDCLPKRLHLAGQPACKWSDRYSGGKPCDRVQHGGSLLCRGRRGEHFPTCVDIWRRWHRRDWVFIRGNGDPGLHSGSFDRIVRDLSRGSIVRNRYKRGRRDPAKNSRAHQRNIRLGGANLSVNLWSAAPTYTNADGQPYAPTGAATWLANFLVSLTQFNDGAAGGGGLTGAAHLALKLASGTAVFADIQALSAQNPFASQTFTIVPELLN